MSADVVHGENVRVIECGGRPRLLFEASQAIRVRRDGARHDFDGDVAPETRITRPIHFAHATGAEDSLNLVGAKSVAGAKHHQELVSLSAASSRPFRRRAPIRPSCGRPTPNTEQRHGIRTRHQGLMPQACDRLERSGPSTPREIARCLSRSTATASVCRGRSDRWCLAFAKWWALGSQVPSAQMRQGRTTAPPGRPGLQTRPDAYVAS